MTNSDAPNITPDADSAKRHIFPVRWRRPSLSTQVLIGLALGVVAGIVFGEWMKALQIVGDVFVGLLQMTVLPYIVVSLVLSLGQLSYREVRLLARTGGVFIVIFWILALLMVLVMVVAFPNWPSATFFSESMIEPHQHVNFVKLYVPANPFYSLTKGLVPAIVLVSLAGGLALIGVKNKQHLLENLQITSDAIMRIAQFVVRLAPIGVFALVAATAGTMSFEDMGRLQVYFLTYVFAALLLTFWILPGLVSVLTPIPFRRVLSKTQDALITAFATYNLLIVLPLLSERIKEMLDEQDMLNADTSGAADLIVPVNFNIPNLGKLLALVFIPFAGWFSGSPLGLDQYPFFLLSGLFSFFGEVVVALPFLLDLMRISSDTFHVFLAVDQFTGRFGTLLAGMQTVVLGLLTAVAVSKRLRWDWARLTRYFIITGVLIVVLFGGLRLFFEFVVPQSYRKGQALAKLDLVSKRPPTRVVPISELGPLINPDTRNRAKLIQERGCLRVGYVSESLPFVYKRKNVGLVGLDVDLMQMMASDLGVSLDFARIKRENIGNLLNNGQIDIAIGGLFATPERALDFTLSRRYMNASISCVVKDYRRAEFGNWDTLKQREGLKLALVDIPFYVRHAARFFPNAQITVVPSPRTFFDAPDGKFDALIYSAEAGSAWTLLYPDFSVVVPKPKVLSVPVSYGLPLEQPELTGFVNAWIRLGRAGTIMDRLYDYWILGRGSKDKKVRWSVVHNVLGWGQPTQSHATPDRAD